MILQLPRQGVLIFKSRLKKEEDSFFNRFTLAFNCQTSVLFPGKKKLKTQVDEINSGLHYCHLLFAIGL